MTKQQGESTMIEQNRQIIDESGMTWAQRALLHKLLDAGTLPIVAYDTAMMIE